MPVEATMKKRIIMVFEKNRYSFSKIDLTANDEKVYGLALILNSFQAVKPPQNIRVETSTQIV